MEDDCCQEPEIPTGAGGPGPSEPPADGTCFPIKNCVDPETGEPVPLTVVLDLSNLDTDGDGIINVEIDGDVIVPKFATFQGQVCTADGLVTVVFCVDQGVTEYVGMIDATGTLQEGVAPVAAPCPPEPIVDTERAFVCNEVSGFYDEVATTYADGEVVATATTETTYLCTDHDVEVECRAGAQTAVLYDTTGPAPVEVAAIATGEACLENCTPGEAWCRRVDQVWVDNQVSPDRPHGGALYPQDSFDITWVLSDGTTGTFHHAATGGGTWGPNVTQLGALLAAATGVPYVGANHGYGDDDDMTTPYFGAALAEVCPGDRYVVQAIATTVGGKRDGRVIELAVGVIPGDVATYYRCGCCGDVPTWFDDNGNPVEAPSGCLNRSCEFPPYPARPESECVGSTIGPFCHIVPADPDNPTTDDIVSTGVFVELDCSGEVLTYFTLAGEDPEPYEFEEGYVGDCDDLSPVPPPEPEKACDEYVPTGRCCVGPAVPAPAWVNLQDGPLDPAQPWIGTPASPAYGGTEGGELAMTVEPHPDFPGIQFSGNSSPSAGGGIYGITPQGDAFWGSEGPRYGFLLSAEEAVGCCGQVEDFVLWLNDIDGGEYVEFFPPAGATVVEEAGTFTVINNPDGSVRYTGAGAPGTNSNGALSITWPASSLPQQFAVIVDYSTGGGVTPFTYATVRPPVEAWADVCDPTVIIYVDPITGKQIDAKSVECRPGGCEVERGGEPLPWVEEPVCFETTCMAAVNDGRYSTAPDTPDDLTGVSLAYELNGTETFLFEDPVTTYTWRDYLEGGRLADLIAANVDFPVEFSYEYLTDDGGNTEIRVIIKGCLPEGGESLGLSFAGGDATTNFDTEEITVPGSGTALTNPETGETVILSGGSVVEGATIVPCPLELEPSGVCACYGDEEAGAGDGTYTYTNDDSTTDISASSNATTIKWSIQLGQEADADGTGPFIAECIANGGQATIKWTTFDGVTSTFVADTVISDGSASGGWAFTGTGGPSWSGKLTSAEITCSEAGAGEAASGTACLWTGYDPSGNLVEEWRDQITGEVLSSELVASLHQCGVAGCVEICPDCPTSTVQTVVCAAEEISGGGTACAYEGQGVVGALGTPEAATINGGVIQFGATNEGILDPIVAGAPTGALIVLWLNLPDSGTGRTITFVPSQWESAADNGILSYRASYNPSCDTAALEANYPLPSLADSYDPLVAAAGGTGVHDIQIARYEYWTESTVGGNAVDVGDQILLVGTVDCEGVLSSSSAYNLDKGNTQVDPVPETEGCDPEPEVEEVRECIRDAAGVEWTQLVIIQADGSQTDPIFINAETLAIGTPAGEPAKWTSCVETADTEIRPVCFYDGDGTRYNGFEVLNFDQYGNYAESTYIVNGTSYLVLPEWARGPFDCQECIQTLGCFDPRIARFNTVTFSDGTVIDLDTLYGADAATANDVMAEVQPAAGGTAGTPTQYSTPPAIGCVGTNLHEFQFVGLSKEIVEIESTIGTLTAVSYGECDSVGFENVENVRLCEVDARFILLVDSGGNFAKYSLNTGQITPVNIPVPSAGSGADIDAYLLYAITGGGDLLTIDVNTNQVVSQVPLFTNDGSPLAYSAASYDNFNDRMLVWDYATDSVYQVDVATGEVSYFSGPFTGISGSGSSFAVDPTTGKFYVSGTSNIYEIPNTAGASGPATIAVSGYSPRANGMTFDADGLLYTSSGPNTAVHNLDTGTSTIIIDDWAPAANSLAYYEVVAPQPACFFRRFGVAADGSRTWLGDFNVSDDSPREVVGDVDCCECSCGGRDGGSASNDDSICVVKGRHAELVGGDAPLGFIGGPGSAIRSITVNVLAEPVTITDADTVSVDYPVGSFTWSATGDTEITNGLLRSVAAGAGGRAIVQWTECV